MIEKKAVRVGEAVKEAAVKRAILGEKGFMKLTANQRKSLRGFGPVEQELHVDEPKSKIVHVTLSDVGDIEVTYPK